MCVTGSKTFVNLVYLAVCRQHFLLIVFKNNFTGIASSQVLGSLRYIGSYKTFGEFPVVVCVICRTLIGSKLKVNINPE